ncbi:hypothetical protein R3P38DRAFT_3242788 [Favolaschia claudopus]|uniref:Uncharacterized protein n=1 Tax=Favolaschia claudopus TaxID=2862362 RepID=A0AAV9Z3V6_9AGAR
MNLWSKVNSNRFLVVREVKFMRRYQGAWPVRAVIKQYLRNFNTNLKRDLLDEEEAAKADGDEWEIPEIRAEDNEIAWEDDEEDDDDEGDDEEENVDAGTRNEGETGGDDEEDLDIDVGDADADFEAAWREENGDEMQEDLFDNVGTGTELHAASWGAEGDEMNKENQNPRNSPQPENKTQWTPSRMGKINARRATIFNTPTSTIYDTVGKIEKAW